ncbi:cytochrome P450 [Periconia macrospinosa]|uniref:Cytochrome P450 n=1 Tax=Periconia macrospinosa TaxID=97972 RepID=A0A2V1DSI4_9PLEO|nr:cytochrome P450 [Periconia macrospinosa]
MYSSLAVSFTLGIVAISIYARFFDPLRDIPGPFLARWSRLWLIYHSRKGDMHTTMINLHQKHGKLVRTGPNEVSTADPESINPIYGARTRFRKSPWYSVSQGHRKFDLFAERDEKIHGAQRRLVNSIYTVENMKKVEPSVNTVIALLLDKLSELGTEPTDMGMWARLFAFDVIGQVTFSKQFGYLENGYDEDDSFKYMHAAVRSAAWVGQIPWLYWAHDRLMPLIGNWLGVNARHGRMRNFVAGEIEKRRDVTQKHHDLLEMLKKVKSEKPIEMNDINVLSMATTNIFAGSETTAVSIGAILYHLCKNPVAMKKLKEEIKSMENEVGSSERCWPLNVANRMPYLQACIQEGLRMHPAVGMALPRTVPEGGIVVAGKLIPEGAVIGANAWVIHREKEIFGDDAHEFKPERWLSENSAQYHRFFFAFGAGARLCIGKNLSWIEISKFIPSLLRGWDLELVHPDERPKQICW